MAWLNIGGKKPAAKPKEETPPFDIEELENGARVAKALLDPLRVEVNRVDGPECDKAMRRLLSEVNHDLEGGLTDHTRARIEAELAEAMPPWFENRRAAETERTSQFNDLLEVLGESLFKMQNRDDKSTARLRDGLTHIEAHGGRKTPAQMKAFIGNMLRALDDMASENDRRVNQMSARIRELHEQVAAKTIEAQTDRLTGINNRATFDDHLKRMLKQATIAPMRFTLLLLDIDHFKAVNDTHGHVEGDRVIKHVAQQLERQIMRKGDFIARYGGEEFAVVLADADGDEGARTAERVREAVEELRIDVRGEPLPVTVSIGVAEGCRADSATHLTRRADDALYLAKQNGRNRVVLAGAGIGRRIRLPKPLTQKARRDHKAKRVSAQAAAAGELTRRRPAAS